MACSSFITVPSSLLEERALEQQMEVFLKKALPSAGGVR
jgi:hypothetical protein